MKLHESPAPLSEAAVLDPEWLTAALQDTAPGAVVGATTVTERLETVATKVRFDVQYSTPVDGAPTALCVKGYFNPAMHGRVAGTMVETRFYQELAADLPVRTPPCVYAAIDPDTSHGLIIMHDLVEAGATFLDPLVGYGADEAAATLEQLALLHAARWGAAHAGMATTYRPRPAELAKIMSTEQLQTQLDDGRAEDVPASVRQAGRVQEAMRAVGRLAEEGPGTLVHGDVHTGNVFRLADGRPGIIDWQVVQRGSWALDVAYHLAAVLAPDVRERSERSLVEHYLSRLAAAGVPPPDRDEAWLAYRRHLPYPLFMWGITRAVHRPNIEALTTRVGLAVAQHRSLDLLGV